MNTNGGGAAPTSAPALSWCPVCQVLLAPWRQRASLAQDLRLALTGPVKLMHSEPVDVLRCARCGSLFRQSDRPFDPVSRYRDDRYGESELWALHHRGRRAYERDRAWLRAHGLERGRRVLEVGCYAGALLAHARASGCALVGVDVGLEVSAFTRALGFDVVTGELETLQLDGEAFDSVFVLNCFEQLPDPAATLRETRRLLRGGGTVVVRTPNAATVRRMHDRNARRAARARGVLGVPFLRCYSAAAVSEMMLGAGFEVMSLRGADTAWMDVAARAS